MAERSPSRKVPVAVILAALGIFALAFLVESLLPEGSRLRRDAIVMAGLLASFCLIIVYVRRRQPSR